VKLTPEELLEAVSQMTVAEVAEMLPTLRKLLDAPPPDAVGCPAVLVIPPKSGGSAQIP